MQSSYVVVAYIFGCWSRGLGACAATDYVTNGSDLRLAPHCCGTLDVVLYSNLEHASVHLVCCLAHRKLVFCARSCAPVTVICTRRGNPKTYNESFIEQISAPPILMPLLIRSFPYCLVPLLSSQKEEGGTISPSLYPLRIRPVNNDCPRSAELFCEHTSGQRRPYCGIDDARVLFSRTRRSSGPDSSGLVFCSQPL